MIKNEFVKKNPNGYTEECNFNIWDFMAELVSCGASLEGWPSDSSDEDGILVRFDPVRDPDLIVIKLRE